LLLSIYLKKNNPSFAKLVGRIKNNNINIKKETIFCFEAKTQKKSLPASKTKQKQLQATFSLLFRPTMQ
jgi:hypothetical protein